MYVVTKEMVQNKVDDIFYLTYGKLDNNCKQNSFVNYNLIPIVGEIHLLEPSDMMVCMKRINKSLMLKKALDDLNEKWKELGLPVVVIKGDTLQRVYPEGVRRIYKDIDIVVSSQVYNDFMTMMEKEGFLVKMSGELISPTTVSMNYFQEIKNHIVLMRDEVKVEAHCKFLDSERFPMVNNQEIYSRCIYNNSFQRYEIEDNDYFIYLLSHFYKHYTNETIKKHRYNEDVVFPLNKLFDIWFWIESNKANLNYEIIKQRIVTWKLVCCIIDK